MSDALGAIHTGSDIRTPLRPQFAVNRNSAISGGTDASDGYYDVDYTWEKAVAGRNTIRKTTMVMPEGSTLTYEYLSTSSLHDADASRVTRVKVSTTAVAAYAYNGVGQLVGTSLPQPDVFMTLYDPADLDDYDRLDNFGRVTQPRRHQHQRRLPIGEGAHHPRTNRRFATSEAAAWRACLSFPPALLRRVSRPLY